MIKSFADRETFDIYYQEDSRKARQRLPTKLWDKAKECLDAIDRAQRPRNLEQYELERLQGTRQNEFSIRINRQYRITFEWDEDDATKVKVEDYHD